MSNIATVDAKKVQPIKSRSKLKAVAPKAVEPSKPKILIYGKAGVGKTWTALDFPNVYYIDTEGGANRNHYTDKLAKSGGVYFGPSQGSLSLDGILEQIQALATEEHGFKTVVIDSITKVFNAEIATETERLAREGIKNEFARDKKPAVALMRRLVNWLQRIDMNVIIIAHEKAQWGTDNKGERSEIGTTFDGYEKLEYELDLALNIIKLPTSRVAKVKKSRLLNFPDASTFPWSYTEFANLYGKEVIEREAHQITLATAEQIEEINSLLGVVKLEEGKWDKILASASVSVISEMSEEQAIKTIAWLRAKLNPKA